MKQTHEFWVTDETDEAVRKAKITLKRVGELTRVVPGEHIEGTVAFGVHPVALSITWRTETAQDARDKEMRRPQTPADKAEHKSLAQAALTTEVANVRGTMGTTLVLEVSADDRSGGAQRNVIERFEDAYMHFDRPDYAPDRLGVLPITIIGIMVVLLLLIAAILLYPRLNRKEKEPTRPAVSLAVPLSPPGRVV